MGSPGFRARFHPLNDVTAYQKPPKTIGHMWKPHVRHLERENWTIFHDLAWIYVVIYVIIQFLFDFQHNSTDHWSIFTFWCQIWGYHVCRIEWDGLWGFLTTFYGLKWTRNVIFWSSHTNFNTNPCQIMENCPIFTFLVSYMMFSHVPYRFRWFLIGSDII